MTESAENSYNIYICMEKLHIYYMAFDNVVEVFVPFVFFFYSHHFVVHAFFSMLVWIVLWKTATGRMLNNLLRIKVWVQGTKIKAMDTDATTICLAEVLDCTCFVEWWVYVCVCVCCRVPVYRYCRPWPLHSFSIMVVTFSYKWHT